MSGQITEKQLTAGFSVADITPKGSVHLGGAVGQYRPVQEVLDPLYARVLVLRSGDKQIMLVTLDVVILGHHYVRRIRDEAVKLGFDSDAVMVHGTQTHTAPSLGHFMLDDDFVIGGGCDDDPAFEWLCGGETRYYEFAFERIVTAMTRAAAMDVSVRLSAGRAIEGRESFNRRAIRRDGKVTMPSERCPGGVGPTDICHIEGPMDPEVGVMALRGADGAIVATLLNFTCHPVCVFPRKIVSADWPGALCSELEQRLGGAFTTATNGCCGNINPRSPFDPDFVPDHQRMGKRLADAAQAALDAMTFDDDPVTLDYCRGVIDIPFRKIPESTMHEVRAVLAAHDGPEWTDHTRTQTTWPWFRAASIMSLYLQQQRRKTFAYEIQILRIGDIALIGLPGEPFVEAQLALKINSPAAFPWVLHMVGHYTGYIPTAEGLPRGGHEADPSYWAKLAPEALEMIIHAAGDVVKQLYTQRI